MVNAGKITNKGQRNGMMKGIKARKDKLKGNRDKKIVRRREGK